MKREVATLPADLPHEFTYDGEALCSNPLQFRCLTCGRDKSHELHAPAKVETAAERVHLVTEKGI